MSQLPILLITGASGAIGSSYRRHLAQTNLPYTLRFTDIQPPKAEEIVGDWRIGNLSDPEFVSEVVAGVHTILHLGADPSPEADFYASLLENNIKATYNIFQAASEAQVQKVIYGSSSSVVFGYKAEDAGLQIHSNMAVRPITMYSATKCFGEAVASVFAHTHGLKTLCVRIGWFMPRAELVSLQNPDLETISRIVTDRDLSHMFDCCLKAENISFAVLPGLSNNRYPFLDLSEARQLVGYTPQDDAFALTGLLPPQNK